MQRGCVQPEIIHMKVFELQPGFGFENLKQVDRPDPKPGAGQVVVQMKAWSLNYRDLLVVTGAYNPRMKLPMVPLSDGAGVVAAVGPGVTRFGAGDRVAPIFMQSWLSGALNDEHGKSALGGALDGVLAEQIIVSQDGLVRVPEHLSFEEAATLPCAAVTAWNALVVSGAVRAGESVLVQGTGGVSLFALQFAKVHGAEVIATSSSDQKLTRVKALGADELINYKNVPEWGKEAAKRAGAIDHVVEVAGAGTLGESLRAVRSGGHIALIGVLAGGAQTFNPIPVLMKGVRLQGIFVGSREMFEAMNRAIALHAMKPVVDRVFGFTEIADALRYMQSGSHFGKIVLRA
jgi:NADPH:quinone reductase-like Zn-dependent oxidoreductase